ncbi:cellulose binding domain-containing protein [Embleya scabrispora]|uniref:cellulose binding domain-containing protein n=1 Tax=Embleya scabrispora TaxID=159449 RepID=UPI000366DED6|nr:cellulose binding domain-containing protein [Embleya scabrispora]MYS78859.1 carbohydrate-binding protein [Streptomyces sp. SID5474]
MISPFPTPHRNSRTSTHRSSQVRPHWRARRPLRTLARVLVAAVIAPIALVVLPSGAAHAATPEATFAKASDWGSGFTGQYTIRNQGATTLTAWRVEFDLPAGTTVGSYWDALQTGSGGGHYVFTNREYNGTLAPGASATFGFLGAGTGTPGNCKLNGNPCVGPAGPDTTAPGTPTDLRVATAGPTALTLSWSASTDDDRVAGYDIYVNGAPTATSAGPSVTLSGLTPGTGYPVKVRAKDPAGNVSPFTPELIATTTTGGGNPPPGSVRSVPYIDITAPTPTLTEVAAATGQKLFTLAFVLGSNSGCDPKWGGTIALDEPRIVNQINALRAQGGDVVVAFGGAAGPYLEASCGSVDTLAAAYTKVIDTLGVKHLDIDIEASIPIGTMNKALAKVQRDRPATTVSFTLMVQGDDYGLTPSLGVDLLKNARDNGVRVDIVNPMAMEFGTSRPVWGDAVITAAESTLRQMKEIWPAKSDAELKAMLAVTPMIGRNYNGKIFVQSDASKLVTWANTNHIGRLAFWSVGRDNGSCPGGGVSPTCSSINQSPYEFTTLFKNFTG